MNAEFPSQVLSDERIRHLRHHSFFSLLTQDEIEMLATLLAEKICLPHETIVTEGDYIDSVFFIVSGTADVQHVSIEPDQTVKTTSVATLKPMDTIGLNERGFYSITGKRTATVVALSEMVLLRLDLAVLHGFALSHSHVNEVMRKNAVEMWQERGRVE